jgi:hypothetical protein
MLGRRVVGNNGCGEATKSRQPPALPPSAMWPLVPWSPGPLVPAASSGSQLPAAKEEDKSPSAVTPSSPPRRVRLANGKCSRNPTEMIRKEERLPNFADVSNAR